MSLVCALKNWDKSQICISLSSYYEESEHTCRRILKFWHKSTYYINNEIFRKQCRFTSYTLYLYSYTISSSWKNNYYILLRGDHVCIHICNDYQLNRFVVLYLESERFGDFGINSTINRSNTDHNWCKLTLAPDNTTNIQILFKLKTFER